MTEGKKTFGIGFGPLNPKISTQLKKQGFKFDAETIKHHEKLAESITYLRFADLINSASAEKATQKLFVVIRRHVMKKNKLKLVK